MEAALRRAVNEFFFRDTWSSATYATFAVVLVSTFFVSNGLTKVFFAFVDSKLRAYEARTIDVRDMHESESVSSSSSNDDSSSEASEDSSNEDDNEPTEFPPVRIRVPSLIEIDATVPLVNDSDHLKTL
ncbi:hypothetical protein ACHHYP_16943 [Achlya hypogyna]|uniref:Uncharacterized protein n=1 Tax=Achlya hypogyna TaxID=1202772 RepID=A0A1V9ZDQ0_ACHHY|nr:hypothetical protein ACHHYP_16943 [Achlya hypogyna]